MIISDIGKIKPRDDFYSYDTKYNSKNIVKVPVVLKEEIYTKIKEYLKKYINF
ncbi:MAG: hypothetical protein IJO32_06330 [Bacilli bacterium]|nr:hypothetical protein [Bacilli bacterium]